jgi:hypothetical protein
VATVTIDFDRAAQVRPPSTPLTGGSAPAVPVRVRVADPHRRKAVRLVVPLDARTASQMRWFRTALIVQLAVATPLLVIAASAVIVYPFAVDGEFGPLFGVLVVALLLAVLLLVGSAASWIVVRPRWSPDVGLHNGRIRVGDVPSAVAQDWVELNEPGLVTISD